MNKLDTYNRRLLYRMQQNCRLTSKILGEEVGLSPSAVERRLNGLRKRGVIASEVAVVDQDTVGCPLTFIVGVTLAHERADLIQGFKQTMQEHPFVQQCYSVTGDVDYILIVNTTDLNAFEEFNYSVLTENPNVRHSYTSVVLSRVKVGLTIPIEEECTDDKYTIPGTPRRRQA